MNNPLVTNLTEKVSADVGLKDPFYIQNIFSGVTMAMNTLS